MATRFDQLQVVEKAFNTPPRFGSPTRYGTSSQAIVAR